MTTKTKSYTAEKIENSLAVIGCTVDTPAAEAKKMYRKLIGQHHEDRVKAPTAELLKKAKQKAKEFVQTLNEAWDVLSHTIYSDDELEAAQAKKSYQDFVNRHNQEQQKKQQREKAKAKKKAEKACIIRDDGQSAMMEGTFQAHELIEVLYQIGKKHMDNIGDAVQNTGQMVDFFRALSTGRVSKVYSLAMLNDKNRIIRMEELTNESPTVQAVATEALLHGAASVYLVVNNPAGDIPKTMNSSQKAKLESMAEGLKLLNINFNDFLIIGQDGYYSMMEAKAIPQTD